MERKGACSLTLAADGAQLFPNLLSAESIARVEEILSHRPREAGVRIYGDLRLSEWVGGTSAIGQLARSLLGTAARPVRAILFDKNRDTNWALDWHQDRTIAVRARAETQGFGNWTVKAGTPHVEPPFAVLERMITARIHLDDVGEDNGPLLIAPGSHQLGRQEESEIGAAVARRGAIACLASAGEVWVYKTAIVHSSKASRYPKTRRVLHIDFAADDLPGSLEWAGIG
ncbi:MAG: phytanoyl-CoA dioxygenase family protein [Sphingomicrobium sp.]